MSTLSKTDLFKIPKFKLEPTLKKAKSYGNTPIKFLGECKLNVNFNGKTVNHKFLVVNENCTSLLGRDLCEKLNFDISIPSCYKIYPIKEDILKKYSYYMSDKFKSKVLEKASLYVNEDATPIYCKARPVPVKMRNMVLQELNRLENEGTISKVKESAWSSPCVNVLKSNNTVRVCGDYSSTLNKNLLVKKYPLPTFEEILGRVGNARYFSRIDLQNAFLQIPLEESSKDYTVINTLNGLYRYNYVPFGVCNSPSIFQAFISKVLCDIDKIVVYQDDILVLTATLDEHLTLLDVVLEKLMKAGLKLNRKKCEFFAKQITYLGHVFDEHGVRPNPEKVRAILDAPEPQNLTQLKSFIGICTFYSRFLANFSSYMEPLYRLLKKGVKFEWKEEQRESFNNFKKLFKNNRVLKLFAPDKPIVIETDASSVGIGAVLMQCTDNIWHPVTFASRTLNRSEINYSQIEKEALGVIYACEKFRQYVLGSEFVLRNDHLPLRKLFASDNNVPMHCSARLQRWALRLSQFKYKFEYIKGKDNLNSDFLSRFPLTDTIAEEEPYELIFMMTEVDKIITYEDIADSTSKDPVLKELKQYIKSGFPNKLPDTVKEFKQFKADLSILKNCIMYRNRVLIPSALRKKVLELFHRDHPGIVAMKSLIRALVWYPGIDKDTSDLVSSCQVCQEHASRPSQNQFLQWPSTTRAWSRIHIDHFFFEEKIFFVAIDSFSKYIECEIVSSTSTDATIDLLRGIFARNGLPDTLVSDNFAGFVSDDFENFLTANGVEHITIAPYTPASNGQGERAVGVIKNLLKKNKEGSIRKRLHNSLLYYRTSPQSATGVSPCMALNGRKYITLKDRINPLYRPESNTNNDKYNSSNKCNSFEIGDKVWALNLRSGPKWYKAVVREIRARNVFIVYVGDLDILWKRHSTQLRPSKIEESIDVDIVINTPSNTP